MKTSTRQLVVIAIMGAIAFALMLLSFPIFPATPFLKLDFSDIPVLFTCFLYGPLAGAGTAFVRGTLHYIQTGGHGGYPIGDLAAFLATLSYMLPVYYLLRKTGVSLHVEKDAFKYYFRMAFAFILGIICLTVVLTFLNYYVITPFYMAVMHFKIPNMQDYILYAIIPFNLVKGLVISIANIVMLSAVLPVARRRLGVASV
ncbi:ECF transporter S component [Aerococcus christensenii]|uniref:ECF transporter S component n=1 Tax=Aerococcus christensenii TaxID=87541 RepID=UPI0007633233|nr:ECF transporter S component [Aerococcus christensenii]AMB92061.1 hypothetical protein AWM71_01415 [Aerococcus christensenii]